MRQIEGTATISIKELDRLREYERWYTELRKDVKGLAKRIENIAAMEYYENITPDIMTEEEIEKEISRTTKEIKIIVSEEKLHKLIYQYLDDTRSPLYCFLSNIVTLEEFENIELVLESGRQK